MISGQLDIGPMQPEVIRSTHHRSGGVLEHGLELGLDAGERARVDLLITDPERLHADLQDALDWLADPDAEQVDPERKRRRVRRPRWRTSTVFAISSYWFVVGGATGFVVGLVA